MKRLLVLLLGTLTSGYAFSQTASDHKFQYKNSVQLDLGGPGLFYSLNYERILINGDKFKTASQAGISYYPASTGVRDIWIPFGINEIRSFGKHHLEAGLGYVVIREAARDDENIPVLWLWSSLLSGRVGYRFQRPDGHFIFRASFIPFLEFGSPPDFHPSGGISVGYCF